MDTLDTLKEIFNGMDIEMDSDDITEDTELFDELGLRPSSLPYLIAAIEDDCSIDLSDADLSQLRTVGDVMELVEEYM